VRKKRVSLLQRATLFFYSFFCLANYNSSRLDRMDLKTRGPPHKVHEPLFKWTKLIYFITWCTRSCFLVMLQSIVAHFVCVECTSECGIIMWFHILGWFHPFTLLPYSMLALHKVHIPLLRWTGLLCFLTCCIQYCFVAMV
jgi:hypothetical protein